MAKILARQTKAFLSQLTGYGCQTLLVTENNYSWRRTEHRGSGSINPVIYLYHNNLQYVRYTGKCYAAHRQWLDVGSDDTLAH